MIVEFMKKIGALLLALTLLLGLGVTAFADGEKGTITLDNPQQGQGYTAYKIFDVAYDNATDPTKYSYTIQSESEWFDDVLLYMGSTWSETEKKFEGNAVEADQTTGVYTGHGLTFTPVPADPDLYMVTVEDGFSAPKFSNYLKGKVTGDTADSKLVNLGIKLTEQSNGTVEATGLDLGYYFVSSTSGALCNLTTTAPEVTIHDKNDVTFEKDADKKDGVEVGQTIHYTLTGKVPDTTGFKDYTYKITDTMSKGLSFNNDIKVYLSKDDELDTTVDTDITEKPEYWEEVQNPTTGCTFELNFKAIKLNEDKHVGEYIFVTYSATVNEQAVTVISENKAVLTYSNDPNDSTKTQTITPDPPKVYSAKIVIDKYERKDNPNDKSTKLEGAQFVLYRVDETTKAQEYYHYDETAKTVSWYTLKNGETLKEVLDDATQTKITVKTTDDNGEASFEGLEDGTYYLLETKAPQGYNLLTEAKDVVIEEYVEEAGDTPERIAAKLTATAKVANNAGSLLPSTGGIGTTIFYVAGAVLVAGAVVLLILRRRRADK